MALIVIWCGLLISAGLYCYRVIMLFKNSPKDLRDNKLLHAAISLKLCVVRTFKRGFGAHDQGSYCLNR